MLKHTDTGNIKTNYKIIKKQPLILLALLLLANINTFGQQKFNELSFYIAAHQDDWQLFMGSDVYKDINDFNETDPNTNGKKVVIIHTTAGNLNDDDTRSCNCKNPCDENAGAVPYWKVRERGARHSIHIAACRLGGWGPGIPYPDYQTAIINGHPVAKYEYKNTVSYYLRLKTADYDYWGNDLNAVVGTADNASTFTGWNDFVNTLYYIYKAEMDNSITSNKVTFHFPDIDTNINPGDHGEHILAGRAGAEAAKLMGANRNTCYPVWLYIDYHTKDLPVNLASPDIQNESAITAAYCLALLDYNAWPEWPLYTDWTARNYYRTITTCDNPVTDNILAHDSLDKLNIKVYPSPANKQLFIRFNIPPKSSVTIKLLNMSGGTVFQFSGVLSSNAFPVDVSRLPNGQYTAVVSNDSGQLCTAPFDVMH